MTRSTASPTKITPETLLKGYASGIFPMSEHVASDEIFWVDPKFRGIFPLQSFHVSRSLARVIKKQDFTVLFNTAFTDVVKACANRPSTWISTEIFSLYTELHKMGFAHSIEVKVGFDLIGGVYGVALGSAFFGESMFSARTNGSKIALTYLIARLKFGGFTLFDTQFLTPHLKSLGAIEIPRRAYREKLADALEGCADFFKLPQDTHSSEILHLSSHTS